MSSQANQKVTYSCSSPAQKQAADMKLVGFDGEKRSLNNKNIKFENDGCQLMSLEQVMYIMMKTTLPIADFPNQGEVLLVHHKFSYS